jgi:orotidine-5'-phosphate decarboxylase
MLEAVIPSAGPDPCERIIVALDFPSAARALAFTDLLEGRCHWVKVGLELFCAAGPSIVETLRQRGLKVFLDLKLHDIPNTVAGAVRSLSSSGASLLTIHAAGGSAMMRAAADAAALNADAPLLLAVTVLTSMDAAALAQTGGAADPEAQVLRLARLAIASGLRGLVCSPQELRLLRAEIDPATQLIVPGIRPAGSDSGDQQRIATPAAAVHDGASRLVIGRPITQAADPLAAFEAVVAELRSGNLATKKV